MSSLWENETHGEEPDRQLAGPSGRRLPASKPLTERGARGGLAGQSWRLLLVFGLLMLVVGVVLAWLLYGDRAGGTSVYQDSVDSGAEPMVRITNGLGRVRIEGTEGETVEITAKRYARGFGPTSAKENAASIPVDIARDGSTVNISSTASCRVRSRLATLTCIGAFLEAVKAYWGRGAQTPGAHLGIPSN